jgi:hypothetical protein
VRCKGFKGGAVLELMLARSYVRRSQARIASLRIIKDRCRPTVPEKHGATVRGWYNGVSEVVCNTLSKIATYLLSHLS